MILKCYDNLHNFRKFMLNQKFNNKLMLNIFEKADRELLSNVYKNCLKYLVGWES